MLAEAFEPTNNAEADIYFSPDELAQTSIRALQVVVDAYVDVLRAGRSIYDDRGRDVIREAGTSFGGLGNTEVRVALFTAQLLLNRPE